MQAHEINGWHRSNPVAMRWNQAGNADLYRKKLSEFLERYLKPRIMNF